MRILCVSHAVSVRVIRWWFGANVNNWNFCVGILESMHFVIHLRSHLRFAISPGQPLNELHPHPIQNIRTTAPVLWRPEREHSDVVRSGLLRQPDRETLVGTVQTAAVARHIGAVHQCGNTAERGWSAEGTFDVCFPTLLTVARPFFHPSDKHAPKPQNTCTHTLKHQQQQYCTCTGSICFCVYGTGRTRTNDEAQHYALLGAGLCDYADAHLVTREATVSDPPASGRCRHYAGEWEEDFRDNGRQKSDVQVLDAAGVGHEYYQSGAEWEDYRVGSYCANAAGRVVGHSAAAGRADWIRHGLCAVGVHAGGWRFS